MQLLTRCQRNMIFIYDRMNDIKYGRASAMQILKIFFIYDTAKSL